MSSIVGYIYKITSPTGRVYIGQAVDIKRRFKRYSYMDCKGQPLLFKSINKYGWEGHRKEIIYRLKSPSSIDLDIAEQKFISFFKSFSYENPKYGLNLTKGGKRNEHLSHPMVFKKMSKSLKGRKHSSETIEKIRMANKGQVPWSKGKKLSPEHIRKIVETKRRKGLWDHVYITPETRKKISKANKGRKFDNHWRENIRNSALNRKSHPNNHPVVAVNPNGSLFMSFPTKASAMRYFGENPLYTNKITQAINKNTQLFGKFWYYESSDIIYSRAA